MTEDQIKQFVRKNLEPHGFSVHEIPEGDNETPDLQVEKDLRYLIEIKSKVDDPEEMAAFEAELATEGIADRSMSFHPQNTMSRAIRKAAKQLVALPQANADLLVLWFLALGINADAQYEQFLGTLYGLTNVVGPDSDYRIPCYYFRHSGFFRRRNEIDAAIVSTLQGGQICLNSYSPRLQILRSSKLVEMFGKHVVDPDAREAAGLAYVADCSADRNDEGQVIRYLCTKYKRSALMSFDMGSMAAYVPADEERL